MNKHKLTKLKQEYENNNNPTQNMLTEQKPDHHPHPPKKMCPVSPLAIKEQERVKETSLVIGCVTAVVVAVAGGERVAGRAGPGGTVDSGE